MDDNTTLLIISALIVLGVIAFIARKRLSSAGFSVGELVKGSVTTHQPTDGATVSEVKTDGEDHEVKAKGRGSSVQDIDIKGKRTRIIAED